MFALDPVMELCRLCARYDAIKMEIFGEEGKERNLVDKIQTCLPFQVSETDKLPKSMCYRCMYNLENYYDFRKKTVNAATLLELCVGKPEDAFELRADLKEQFEQLKAQLQQIKKKKITSDDKENTIPQLESQFLVPSEAINGRSSSPVSGPATPLEDDIDEEVMDLEMEDSEDVIIDSNSVECEVLEDVVMEDSLGYNKDRKTPAEQKSIRFEDGQEEGALHTCSICSKAFSSKGHLALHNKIHSKESTSSKPATDASAAGSAWKSGYYRPYQCDLCNKSYSTAKHRWGHVSVCHRGDPLVTCPVCSRVFSTCYNLEEHKRTKHGMEDDGESAPAKPLSSTEHLSLPSNNAIKPSSPTASTEEAPHISLDEALLHTCAQCLKVFKSEVELEQHSLTHLQSSSKSSSPEPTRKSLSAFTSEMSLLKQTLLQSRSAVTEGKKRQSSVEEAECSANKKAAVEIASETTPTGGSRRKNSKPRKIEQRNEEHTRENLELSSEDSMANQGYVCSVCSQMFSSMVELQEHSIIHEEEAAATSSENSVAKPFSCLLCEKDFSLRTSLSRHFNACHGIDPAEIMDISKYQRSPKKIIPRSKEEEQGPVVDEDDLFDVTAEDEENDTRTENKSQQGGSFACEVCSREFGDRASLWLHLRYTHKEYAAYACGVCLQICGSNTHMYEHWTTQHPPDRASTEQRRYSCQMCGRQHDSRKKLLAHVLVHNLDDGSGGTYDPELLVTLNTGFYNFEARDNHDSPATVNEFNSTLEAEFGSAECGGGEYMGNAALFGCELCYKSFPTEDGLVKHKKGAHRLDPRASSSTPNNSKGSYQLYFVCELCGSSHRSKSERWRHVFRTHGGEQTLTCDRPGCGKVFPTRALRQDHCNNHHRLQGATPNVCEICGKLWGTRVDFWKHLMGVHPDCVPLTCGVCLKIFCSVPELQNHVSANHMPLTGGDFCCDICGRPYSNRSKLSRHRRIHLVAESGDISCYPEMLLGTPGTVARRTAFPTLMQKLAQDTAGKFDKSQAELQGLKSKQKPPALPPLYCDACPDAVFENIFNLAEHRRTIHGLFPCDLCSKFYGRTSHLWKHVKRVHNNHPELTCPICKRISASKSHLETHIATKHRSLESKTSTPKTQELEVPSLIAANIPTLYPCHKCSRRFYKRHLLTKHQLHCPARRHRAKPKPDDGSITEHPCVTCAKVFSSHSKLRDHQRVIHAPQNCELCSDVTYNSKTDLLHHIKDTHADDPNFACSHPGCNRTMRSRADRDRHVAMHRSFKYPPTCSLCGENCANRVKAWSHYSARHKSSISNVCGVCYDHFPSTSALVEHVRTLHTRVLRNKDTCKICVKTYSSFYKVLMHHANHHPDYHICRQCLEVFAEKQELDDHVEKEHEKKEEEQEEDKEQQEEENKLQKTQTSTSVSAENVDELPAPLAVVIKEEKTDEMECSQYEEEFVTEEGDQHTASKHPAEDTAAKRQLTPDAGGNPSTVKRPRRSYDCDKCPEIFRSPSDLVEHKKRHQKTSVSEAKPYHCTQCEKYFTNKSSYWRHINSPAHHAAKLQVQQKLSDEYSTSRSESTANKSTAMVYIPESNLRETLMRRVKMELDMLDDSDQDSKSLTESEVDKDLSLENESFKESPITSKPARKRPESRKVYRGGPDVPCQCQLCGKQWPAMKHLWQHLIRNHRHEAAVTCGVCLEVCQDYASLSAHLTSQHPDNFKGEGNNFTCRICGRYHNARSKLIQHATIHIILGSAPEQQPQSNVHSCRFCFKAFTDESTLQEHVKTQHSSGSISKTARPAELSPHTCDICFKVCGNEGALVSHKKSHQRGTTEYSHPKDDVDVVETDEDDDNESATEHGSKEENDNDEDDDEDDEDDDEEEEDDDDDDDDEQTSVTSESKLYKCDMCPKTFRDKNDFKGHVKSHPQIADLHLQMRKKTPVVALPELPRQEVEKQTFYVCSVCSQVFKTPAALSVHQSTHHQQRSLSSGKFPCASCSEGFPTIAALSEHVKASHAKMFTCTRCNKKSFSSYVNLTKHYRTCQPQAAYSQNKNQLESSTNLSEDSQDSSGDESSFTKSNRHATPAYSNTSNSKNVADQGAKKNLDLMIGIPNIGLRRLSSSSDDSDEDITAQTSTKSSIGQATEVESINKLPGNSIPDVSDHETRTSNISVVSQEAREDSAKVGQEEQVTVPGSGGSNKEFTKSVITLSDDESQDSVKSVKQEEDIFVVSLSDDSEMSIKDCKEDAGGENGVVSRVASSEINQELTATQESEPRPDPEPETGSEPGCYPEPERRSEPGLNSGAGPEPETGSEPGCYPEPERRSEPGLNPGADPEPETLSEPETGSEPGLNPGAGPEPETLSEPGCDPESETLSDPESDPEPETEPGLNPGTGPELETLSEPGCDPEPETVSEPGRDPESETVSEPGRDPESETVSEPGRDPESETVSELGHDPEPETGSVPVPVPVSDKTESSRNVIDLAAPVAEEQNPVGEVKPQAQGTKGKDYLFSLEDALDKLEAENSEK